MQCTYILCVGIYSVIRVCNKPARCRRRRPIAAGMRVRTHPDLLTHSYIFLCSYTFFTRPLLYYIESRQRPPPPFGMQTQGSVRVIIIIISFFFFVIFIGSLSIGNFYPTRRYLKHNNNNTN